MLNAIGIVSRDLVKSVRFYAAVGVTFDDETRGAGAFARPHIEGICQPTGLRIMFDALDLVKKIHPAWEAPTGSSPVALCFLQNVPSEVDVKYADAVSAGGTGLKAPFDAPWGQRYASVLDPDGNQVDFFAALPAPSPDK